MMAQILGQLLALIIISSYVSSVSIKIIDGIDKYSDRDENQLAFIQPNIFTGPETLLFMKGSCFIQSFDRYEYSICPFYNITEKRISGLKSSLLGIWKEWDIEINQQQNINGNTEDIHNHANMTNHNDNLPLIHSELDYYYKQRYNDGKLCSNDKNHSNVILQFECNYPNKITIISVEDTDMCEYKIRLGLPISCSLLYQ